MTGNVVEIFTDGSCHTGLKIGAWASLIFTGRETIPLEGIVVDTSHNRMEIMAVLEAFTYLLKNNIKFDKAVVYSDSQYVVNIGQRRDALKKANYLTKKGSPVQNTDLVKSLISLIESYSIDFIKVAAHQKETGEVNYNRYVDKKARKILREEVKKHSNRE